MHGIILHEEYRGWLRKLSNEDLGKIIENMFRVDDGETPVIFNDDHLDFLSETLCNRMVRDIEKSDKQRANRLGKTKNNQTKTKQEPKKTPITNNLLPITNNQLPITNNQLPITNKDLKEKINKEKNLFVEDIISYLNFKAGTHYQPRGKAEELINARMNDGYTVDDFKRVIDKKVREWKGTSYEKFIRPNTLFAPSHFDEYLNQPETKGTDDMLMDWLNGKESNDTGGVFANSANNESGLYGFKVYPE